VQLAQEPPFQILLRKPVLQIRCFNNEESKTLGYGLGYYNKEYRRVPPWWRKLFGAISNVFAAN